MFLLEECLAAVAVQNLAMKGGYALKYHAACNLRYLGIVSSSRLGLIGGIPALMTL